jgi:hypothetical protein
MIRLQIVPLGSNISYMYYGNDCYIGTKNITIYNFGGKSFTSFKRFLKHGIFQCKYYNNI